MKERPILFSAQMVRALLDGTKTQTRRVLKTRPDCAHPNKADLPGMRQIMRTCPYGQPGDRLWVREAWKAHSTFDHMPPRDIPKTCVWYTADSGYMPGSRSRPSIHMPRWASRIMLEITGVRVERLQDISIADAIAEGVVECTPRLRGLGHCMEWLYAYEDLWTSINGPGSWDANPWVWVVEFKRVEGGAA